ncbi:WXG100 family type VII secretion target [Butyricicoccus sp.]|uniref:WXG100 family type VII secretion target n=1 Tax=Butyricicoccus sp. TaxID=2049021 RepID=UPI003F14E25F
MEVFIDFQQVIAQARQIETLAETLRQESEGNVANALAELSSAWKGTAADAYLKKGTRFQDELTKTANDLSCTAVVIKEIAKALYDAEQKAAELGIQRQY